MSDSSINPYQPPTSATQPVESVPIDEIRFQLTKQNLRHGQSHHLIRCRPYAVTIVSVLMIVVSLIVFSYAVYLIGNLLALVLMPLLLAVSAWAYQSVIAQPQQLTSQRMAECGLVAGADVSIVPQEDHLIVKTHVNAEDQSFHWNRDEIKCYRTPLGLMIVPERYVFLFLPRRGQFDPITYQSIVKLFLKG